MDIRDYISSGIIEAYVLGIASEEEILEVERLRLQYPELDAAIIDFERSLESRDLRQNIAPPPHLKDAIWQKIQEDEPAIGQLAEEMAPPIIPVSEPTKPAIPIASGKWRLVAAAAIIGFLFCGGYSIYLYQKYTELSRDYAALQKENTAEKLRFNSLNASIFRMQESHIQKISLPGVKGHEQELATVYYDTRTGEVFLFPVRLQAPPPQSQYQLWAIVDGKPVDAGVLDPNCSSLCQLKNVKNPQAFAITLEKQGGSPEPTLSAMVVMGAI